MTATAIEITDSRLDVIGYARDVRERARKEAGDRPHRRVVFALAALDGALRRWDGATSQREKDEAVRMVRLHRKQLVRVIAAECGWDAARVVSRGDDEEEWAA